MKFPRMALALVLWFSLLFPGPGFAVDPVDFEANVAKLEAFSETFAEVASRLRPGVVSIVSERVVQVRDPFGEMFSDPFFQRFFQFRAPQPREEQRRQGQGSGVIVSADGYILTNHHVIENADNIRVSLADDRSFEATIVGVDPQSDLAVLKVEARDLPALPLGDSDRLRVGQWALALGNPFGLQHTVTYGIVSAVGRGNVGLVDYEDFIQTDAAINPGNSGGALANLRGEVIGINTAIVTRSGGYQGVGFAIPINMARNIMQQLIDHGEVRRGFLGVSIQNLTQEMAEAMNLKVRRGVLISGVEKNTPADRAGLKRGDIILELDGRTLRDADDLRNRVAQTQPGSTVRLKILRDGRERTLSIVLGELEARSMASADVSRRQEKLGWEVQELTGDLASRLGVEEGSGLLITNVQAGTPAHRAGLRRGDLIVEINRRPVRTMEEYTQTLERAQPGASVLLLVRRENQTFFAALRMPE